MYTRSFTLWEEMMYIITVPTRGVRRRVLAAYECQDGRIRFDETRGDAEFIRRLQEEGVPVSMTRGAERIRPDAGRAFHEACLALYSSPHLSCDDEDRLEELRRQFPSPTSDRHSVPPPSAA